MCAGRCVSKSIIRLGPQTPHRVVSLIGCCAVDVAVAAAFLAVKPNVQTALVAERAAPCRRRCGVVHQQSGSFVEPYSWPTEREKTRLAQLRSAARRSEA